VAPPLGRRVVKCGEGDRAWLVCQGVRLSVWRMVVGYQRRPPWAVGTWSVLSPLAIWVRVWRRAVQGRLRSRCSV
jgi:hypothetical protein